MKIKPFNLISKEEIHDFIDRVYDDMTDKENEPFVNAKFVIENPVPFAMHDILKCCKDLYDNDVGASDAIRRGQCIEDLADIMLLINKYYKYNKYTEDGYLEYTNAWFKDGTLPEL